MLMIYDGDDKDTYTMTETKTDIKTKTYMMVMMKIHLYTRWPLTLSPDPRQVTRKKLDFLLWRKGMKKNETEKQSFSICFQKAREEKYVIIIGHLNLK